MSFHPLLLSAGTFIRIAQFFVSLSLLIILHEGGHFFFARLFKTRVEKFYLFFDFMFPFPGLLNFSLFKKKKGDTEYGIGWFPLGGYVKIAGMVDESMDKEALAKPPEPWEYRSKPAWQRLFIMLGGIIVNVLLALVIYTGVMYAWGEKHLPMSELKDGMMVADSMGNRLGFQTGDRIVSLDGKQVQNFEQLHEELLYTHDVEIIRNGQPMSIILPQDLIGQLPNDIHSIFTYRFPTVVDTVDPKFVDAAKLLKKDDRITAINGMAVPYFDQFKAKVDSLKGQDVQLTVLRNSQPMTIPVHVNDTGRIGIVANTEISSDSLQSWGYYHFITKKYGFFEAFPAGISRSARVVRSYARQFKLIFNHKTGAYKKVGGFATMAKVFPEEWDWQSFWNITAFLSIVLAFMNLLPIPGLDGGYVLFLLIEMITRRKVSDRTLEIANTIGLVLLLALMVFANGNDIFKAFRH